MTAADATVPTTYATLLKRRHAVTIGRIVLALALLAVWKIGADTAGPLFVADPIKVALRLYTDAQSGLLFSHTYVTLRISAIGFALGCLAGVILPFLLRLVPRFSAAIEPFILASVGIPKYALIPLFILYFGINDAPKLWLIGLLVFYPVFIAVFAGIRNVDGRLVNMARIVGAGEAAITREVIWNSLLPFFFASLKIALPRAVSAAIIGEFLVGNAGLGYMIEHARQSFDITGAFAGIVAATAVVLVINAIVVRIDRHVSAWRPVEREMAV